MCLQLFVVPSSQGVDAKHLGDLSGLCVQVTKAPVPGALVFSLDGGCSCSLMEENADWNSPTWSLKPSVLAGLAAAVEALDEESNGFTFQAYWAGDQPKTKTIVSIDDLLRDIRANAVKNRHVYVIRAETA